MPVAAEVHVFDFSSLISGSSFVSMAKAVAPRNLVLLQGPPTSEPAANHPLLSRLTDALSGSQCTIHRPVSGSVVPMPGTAVYVAELAPELAAQVEAQGRIVRPPYHLGWLDGVVSGVRILHSRVRLPLAADPSQTCAWRLASQPSSYCT